MARITIGNTAVKGYVNFVTAGRFVVGTGSYTNKENEKVFKESITIFTDDKFDGEVPAKGDYVQVSGDIIVSPRRDHEDQLNATMNVRFKNQVTKLEAPTKKEGAPETAGAGAGGDGGDGLDQDI